MKAAAGTQTAQQWFWFSGDGEFSWQAQKK